jgi:hypothetical protein
MGELLRHRNGAVIVISGLTYGEVDPGIAVPLFRLIDVQLGAPDRSVSALDAPAVDGQYFASIKNGTREIAIIFCLPDESATVRAQAIARLMAIFAGRAPKPLRAMEIGSQRYINAVCTQFPSLPRLEWTAELTAGFTAFDPYIYSDIYDLDVALAAGGSVSFPIGCTGSVRPVITQEIAAALTDPTWTCSNGQMIMLQGSVAPGTLTIDCEKRQITHSADNEIMASLSLDSLFFDFAPNPATEFAPYMMVCTNGAAGKMRGKYRWL